MRKDILDLDSPENAVCQVGIKHRSAHLEFRLHNST